MTTSDSESPRPSFFCLTSCLDKRAESEFYLNSGLQLSEGIKRILELNASTMYGKSFIY